MRILNLGIFIVLLAFLFVPCITIPANASLASEPSLTEIFNYLGFTNVAEENIETFPAGLYEITLYAEFAGYHNENELSYYTVGTSTYNLIFAGPEGGSEYLYTPITKTIVADSQFGLSILTPENHTYFTENHLNPDEQQHAIVYKNLDAPYMFLIGFEDLYGAGDRDYQDIVFSLKLKTSNVVPEVPFGTILIILTMFISFLGFVGFKRFRHQQKQNPRFHFACVSKD